MTGGGHNEKSARPTVCRSPSWSWVAVDDEIFYPPDLVVKIMSERNVIVH
jgi:hypothetical protein